MVKILNKLFLILLLFISISADAQVKGVEINIHPQSGNLNTRFILQVTLDLELHTNLVQLDTNDNFELLGQNNRSEVSIINGKISQKNTFSFTLSALKPGTLNLPDILIGDKKNPIRIAGPQVSVSDSVTDDLDSKVSKNTLIKFQQSASELEIYQGEQVIISLDAYSANSIHSVEPGTMNFDGFWVEQLEEDKIHRYRQRDQIVYAYSSRRAAYPLKSGTIELPERNFNFTIIEPLQQINPFDFFSNFPLGGQQRTLRINSNNLEIKVLPLPTATNKIDSDWGNRQIVVGKTTLNMTSNNNPMTVGESRSFRVLIASYGNLNPLKKLPIVSQNTFNIYEEPVQLRKQLQAGKLMMEAEFNFSIVPTKSGKIKFAALKFIYFHPELKQYQELYTDPIEIEVTAPSDKDKNIQPVPIDTEQTKPTTETQRNEELYRAPTKFEKIVERISLAALIWFLLVIFIIFGLGAAFYIFLRKIRPIRLLKKRMDIAENSEQLKNCLYELISFKTGQNLTNFSFKELAHWVTTLGLDTNLVFLIQNTLDQLEILHFKPAKNNLEQLEQLKNKCCQILESW